jgi:hypothetical protein
MEQNLLDIMLVHFNAKHTWGKITQSGIPKFVLTIPQHQINGQDHKTVTSTFL